MTPIRKVLLDILESQSFDRLDPFTQSEVWGTLPHDERVLLANLLVMQGAHQLAQGNQQALESFERANRISSHSPEILYQQGCVLAHHRENIRCLNLAAKTFASALEQDPFLFKGWHMYANVLLDIGFFEGESSYFIQANECFEKMQSLREGYIEDFISEESFYWKWGICLAALGKISGEPIDFHRAVEKFRKAYALGCRDARFLNDFGLCLFDLGSLLETPGCFTEALELFNEVVFQNPDFFHGWFNQACCLKSLINFKSSSKLFEEAEYSFKKAMEIDPDSSPLWLNWGRLEMMLGKLKHDPQVFEESLSKFARADELEPGNSQILSSWAECELCLGTEEERLDLLQSSRIKIIRSLEIQPEDPGTWYLYGACLNELGRYFNDEDYYIQAIDKFKYGLSLTRHYPSLWYGLALSHFAIGELREEQSYYEKAARYCSRVLECKGEGFPQFWNDWGVALLKLAEITGQISYAEMAIEKFEKALKLPFEELSEDDLDLEWVFNYGCAFDLLGDLKEEPQYFEKAVQIFTQILRMDPDYSMVRYNLALAFAQLGEALDDIEYYHKAIEQFQVLLDQNLEDEMIYLDFGVALTSLGLLVHDAHHLEQSQSLYRQAETHLMQALVLGNTQAYYQLAGLYSITGHSQQAMHYLERALAADALPGIEDLMHDDWLERLRGTSAFRQFISQLSTRQSNDGHGQ